MDDAYRKISFREAHELLEKEPQICFFDVREEEESRPGTPPARSFTRSARSTARAPRSASRTSIRRCCSIAAAGRAASVRR